MPTLNRYILREIVPIFFLSNIFFIFVLLLDKLIDLTDLFFSKNVPAIIIIETIIFYLPSFLMITIPTSALLAVMTAHNRLSADSEIVVIKSIGVSPYNLTKPTILFGIFATLLAFITSYTLLPYGNQLAIKNLKKTINYISIKDIKENEFYNELPNLTLHVTKKYDNTIYEGITIIDNKGENFITAKEGKILQSVGKIIFDLKQGTLVNGKDEKYSKISFGKFYYIFSIDAQLKRDIKQERFMFFSELIENFHKGDIYKFELSKRIALPLSTMIMAILGLNMGIFFHRSNKSINWIIALTTIFTYNMIMFLSENLINFTNPFFAPWIANIIFSIIPLITLKRCIS